jgi:hypothetical protein
MVPSARTGWADRYGVTLALALAAYAIAGKGFAYLGMPPLYVTELLLVLGLLAMLQTGCILASALSLPALVLLVLMTLTVLRTFPYVPTYGFDALRDSVLILYAFFAFVVATLLLQRPERLAGVLGFLRHFTSIYVFAGPAAYLVGVFGLLPTMPGTGVPILSIRAGELGVHLSACAILALVGLRTAQPLWLASLLLGVMVVASQSRGGLLAILIPVAFTLPFTPVWRHAVLVGLAGALVLGIGYAADVQMPALPGPDGKAASRQFGARQIVDNALSLVVPSDNRQLDDTKAFRTMWWKHIWDYTVGGRYFWIGKGFGVNLAVDDGFVGDARDGPPLRSPHNSHMNILARTGVPGFLLWVLFALSWFATVIACASRAWRNGDRDWGNLLLFLASIWLSNFINASFDVALEGPMLGVWFWCQTGLGLGVVAIYRARSALPRRRALDLRHGHLGRSAATPG